MNSESGERPSLKERAVEELKAFWLIALYLALFLGALTFYRRLILAEFGVTYLHYGIAVIEALIIAKVILIGKALKVGGRFERSPLIVSVIVKSILFGALVLLFGILEHVVEGLLHKKDWQEHSAQPRRGRHLRAAGSHADDDRGLRSVFRVLGDRTSHRATQALHDVLFEAGFCTRG